MNKEHELPLDGTDEVYFLMSRLHNVGTEIELEELEQEIIAQQPTSEQIVQIMDVPGVDQERLFACLIAGKPQNAYVREVIERYPELREAAADWLLANNPSGFDIRLVIRRVRNRRRQAVELLLKLPLGGSDLHFAMEHVPAMRDRLFDHFISQRRSAMSLGCVMLDFERYRPHLRRLMNEWNISEEQILDGILRGKRGGLHNLYHGEIREQLRHRLGWT